MKLIVKQRVLTFSGNKFIEAVENFEIENKKGDLNLSCGDSLFYKFNKKNKRIEVSLINIVDTKKGYIITNTKEFGLNEGAEIFDFENTIRGESIFVSIVEN